MATSLASLQPIAPKMSFVGKGIDTYNAEDRTKVGTANNTVARALLAFKSCLFVIATLDFISVTDRRCRISFLG